MVDDKAHCALPLKNQLSLLPTVTNATMVDDKAHCSLYVIQLSSLRQTVGTPQW